MQLPSSWMCPQRHLKRKKKTWCLALLTSMGFERNRILVGNTHATKLDVFLSGEDETSNFMWHCDQQGLLDADESFGFTDFSWVSDAVGIWPRLTYDLFCTPREKRRDPIQQWCRCDSCLWRVWFLLRCFKFWVLVVVVYIHGIYTLGIYNYCITQTVYPPISHTVLWPGVNGPFYVWGFVV